MAAQAGPEIKSSKQAIQRWNIAVGNFFFKFRNQLFPSISLAAVLVLRPRLILGSPALNTILIAVGTTMVLAGGVLRLLTIGLEYIHRGGKNKTIYAGRLVTGGMYSCTRNPMYVANLLIVTGMTLATCSPEAYAVLIPIFVFVYQAILAAEEDYLTKRFGRDYEEYCATVNRFLPSLRNLPNTFSGMVWDWRRAIRKDLGTVMGLVAGLSFLPVWRAYFLEGFPAARDAGAVALTFLPLAGVLWIVLHYLKKTHKALFSRETDNPGET